MHSSRWLGFAVAGCLCASAVAQSLQKQQEAMALIKDYAAFACDSVKTQGKTSTLEVSSDAKAKLSGVVKKLADLGVEGAAKYQSSEYEGLLQADLAKALAEQANCRLAVLRELKDKLLPSDKSVPPKPKTSSAISELRQVTLDSVHKMPSFDLGVRKSEFLKSLRANLSTNNEIDVEDRRIRVSGTYEPYRRSTTFFFDSDKLAFLVLRRSYASEVPYRTRQNAVEITPQYSAALKQDQIHRMTECEEQERTEVFSTTAFGPPVQQIKQYMESSDYLDPENRKFSANKVFLFLPPDGSYVVLSRNVKKVVFEFSSMPYVRSEKNLFDAQGDGIMCEQEIEVGRGKVAGAGAYNSRVTGLGPGKSI